MHHKNPSTPPILPISLCHPENSAATTAATSIATLMIYTRIIAPRNLVIYVTNHNDPILNRTYVFTQDAWLNARKINLLYSDDPVQARHIEDFIVAEYPEFQFTRRLIRYEVAGSMRPSHFRSHSAP